MIGGAYAESDVARASLVQMNEISRRAEVAGMSFVGVGSVGGAGGGKGGRGIGGGEGVDGGLKMIADAAGLVGASEADMKAVLGGVGLGLGDSGGSGGGMNGMPLITSRQDALARIEELHRSRPTSAQGQGQANNNRDVTFGVNGTYQLPFEGGDNTWAAAGGSDPNNRSSTNGSTSGGTGSVGAGTETATSTSTSDGGSGGFGWIISSRERPSRSSGFTRIHNGASDAQERA
jgi:osomolarity two-component system response regulator SKN7